MTAEVLDEPRARRRRADIRRVPSVSLRSASRMWQRNAILFRRGWKRYALPNFLEPVLYLLAIGIGIGVYIGDEVNGVPYVDFMAPGLAASSAMYGAIFETTYNVFVKLRFAVMYDAVITTPLEPEDVAMGELMWAVTRSAIYGGTFLLVLSLLGHARSPLTLLGFVMLPLIGLAMGLLGMIFTAIIVDIDRYTYFFNLFVIPLFLFSGIFFPVENLPDWAEWLAWLTPLYHGVAMSRALVLYGDLASALLHALWLVVFSAILIPPALNLFRRRLVGAS